MDEHVGARFIVPQTYTSDSCYDAIVIGAGLGGLLSAAQLLQRGKRVVLLERLSHCGGRFTAKTFQGVQMSTGAVHMVPFGSSGVLARMLCSLGIPHRFYDADVFGSFHVHGKQYRVRGLLGVFWFLGPRQFFWLLLLGYLMFLHPLPKQEQNLPFALWLKRHINTTRNPQLVAFFECISRFTLSLELHQVSIAEVTRITKNMLRYGAPAIVEGGCGELTRQLEQHVLAQGAEVRLSCEVQPTNSDPHLAPPGKHLLISHQVIQSNNIEEERALALADLRMLFGEAFDKHCRVLTMGTYRGEWPVNRIAQGADLHPTTTVEGLYLVGDAVKPPGYLMVEGVAQSVNCLLDLLQAQEGKRGTHVLQPPSSLNALRWLWKAPGNAGKL